MEKEENQNLHSDSMDEIKENKDSNKTSKNKDLNPEDKKNFTKSIESVKDLFSAAQKIDSSL